MWPPGMTLLYFSPVAWSSYAQRPHLFVQHFLRQSDRSVIWVDPYPTRLPVIADLFRPHRQTLTTPRPPGLTVLTLQGFPVEPLPVVGQINRRLLQRTFMRHLGRLTITRDRLGIVVGRPSRLALAVLQDVPHAWAAYDAMDDFPEFYRGLSRRSTRVLEQRIADASDVILTTSTGLWEKFASHADKRVLVRNAFEMSSLPPVPSSRNGTVFGYVGCVSSWFDWSLVTQLARSLPAAKVRIIGPRVMTPRRLPDNVELAPACSHDEAIGHMQRFSVGLIPFKASRLTDSVDPIKYYAYRAMGLPVLTTRFGEMKVHGTAEGTFFMDPGTLERAAASALQTPVDLAAVRQFREEHDWHRRFSEAGLFERILPS